MVVSIAVPRIKHMLEKLMINLIEYRDTEDDPAKKHILSEIFFGYLNTRPAGGVFAPFM